MRAKMITSLAGPEGVCQPGEIVSGPDARIEALVASGHAEACGEEGEARLVLGAAPTPETAEASPAMETADAPAGRRKKG